MTILIRIPLLFKTHFFLLSVIIMFFNRLEICIIGNKTDMADEREIPTSTGQEFAQSVRALFTETTAKDSKGTHQNILATVTTIIIFMNIF